MIYNKNKIATLKTTYYGLILPKITCTVAKWGNFSNENLTKYESCKELFQQIQAYRSEQN